MINYIVLLVTNYLRTKDEIYHIEEGLRLNKYKTKMHGNYIGPIDIYWMWKMLVLY